MKLDKEQTPLQELIEQVKLIHGAVPLEEEYFERLLTKEKEQREELIKEVCIESYKEGWKYGYNIAKGNAIILKLSTAEQYYNEVIKPKYKL